MMTAKNIRDIDLNKYQVEQTHGRLDQYFEQFPNLRILVFTGNEAVLNSIFFHYSVWALPNTKFTLTPLEAKNENEHSQAHS